MFELSAEDIALLNPNTRTCPIFRTRRDAEITKGIYRRVPVLIREGDPGGNPWGVTFRQGLFNMTSDSGLFHIRGELEAEGWELEGNIFVRDGERMLPLYEAKMIHHFDSRWATYERDGTVRDVTSDEKADPKFHVMPRYWVSADVVNQRLGPWAEDWILGWRDICRSSDERTVISSRVGRFGVGHTMPVVLGLSDEVALWFQIVASSYALDFVARQKIGGTHLTYGFLKQLPFPRLRPASAGLLDSARLLLGADASSDVRARLRADLDAAVFREFGMERAEIVYILDTFPIVRRKDEARFGEYRTKRLILESFDRLVEQTDAAAVA